MENVPGHTRYHFSTKCSFLTTPSAAGDDFEDVEFGKESEIKIYYISDSYVNIRGCLRGGCTGCGCIRGECSGCGCMQCECIGCGCLRSECTGCACLRGSCTGCGCLRGSCIRYGCMRGSCTGCGCMRGSCTGCGCMRGSCTGCGCIKGGCMNRNAYQPDKSSLHTDCLKEGCCQKEKVNRDNYNKGTRNDIDKYPEEESTKEKVYDNHNSDSKNVFIAQNKLFPTSANRRNENCVYSTNQYSDNDSNTFEYIETIDRNNDTTKSNNTFELRAFQPNKSARTNGCDLKILASPKSNQYVEDVNIASLILPSPADTHITEPKQKFINQDCPNEESEFDLCPESKYPLIYNFKGTGEDYNVDNEERFLEVSELKDLEFPPTIWVEDTVTNCKTVKHQKTEDDGVRIHREETVKHRYITEDDGVRIHREEMCYMKKVHPKLEPEILMNENMCTNSINAERFDVDTNSKEIYVTICNSRTVAERNSNVKSVNNDMNFDNANILKHTSCVTTTEKICSEDRRDTQIYVASTKLKETIDPISSSSKEAEINCAANATDVLLFGDTCDLVSNSARDCDVKPFSKDINVNETESPKHFCNVIDTKNSNSLDSAKPDIFDQEVKFQRSCDTDTEVEVTRREQTDKRNKKIFKQLALKEQITARHVILRTMKSESIVNPRLSTNISLNIQDCMIMLTHCYMLYRFLTTSIDYFFSVNDYIEYLNRYNAITNNPKTHIFAVEENIQSQLSEHLEDKANLVNETKTGKPQASTKCFLYHDNRLSLECNYTDSLTSDTDNIKMTKTEISPSVASDSTMRKQAQNTDVDKVLVDHKSTISAISDRRDNSFKNTPENIDKRFLQTDQHFNSDIFETFSLTSFFNRKPFDINIAKAKDPSICSISTNYSVPNQSINYGSEAKKMFKSLGVALRIETSLQIPDMFRQIYADLHRMIFVRSLVREFYPRINTYHTYVLERYFNLYERGHPPTVEEQMRFEWLRFISFKTYTGNGNVLVLAKNGFYHDSSQGLTVTKCIYCGVTHSNWERFDDIVAEHRKLSPNCPICNNARDDVNLPIAPDNAQPTLAAEAIPSHSIFERNIGASTIIGGDNRPTTVENLSVNLQRASLTQTRNEEAEGSSERCEVNPYLNIVQQPSDDRESHEREPYIQTSFIRPFGLNGTSYTRIAAPSVNNLAEGARTNVTATSVSSTTTNQSTLENATTLGQQICNNFPAAGAFASQTGIHQPTSNQKGSSITTNIASGVRLGPDNARADPTAGVTVSNPKHPDYSKIDARTNSYRGWPEYLDQTPRQMAEAGFFYVGVSDFTRCYACGGGLRNWEPGDDPILEHTRWFPRCEYVNQLKGERYVQAVERRHREHMAERQRQQNEIAQRKAAMQRRPDALNTPAGVALKEMGYADAKIRQAVDAVRQQTGQPEVTPEQVLLWILDDEERQSTQHVPEIVSTNLSTYTPMTVLSVAMAPPTAVRLMSENVQQSSTNIAVKISENQSRASNDTRNQGAAASNLGIAKISSGESLQREDDNGVREDENGLKEASKKIVKKKKKKREKSAIKLSKVQLPNASGGPNIDEKSLLQENEKLRERQICKICMTNTVDTTLLPCGHLVTCESCAKRLKKCPICRTLIKSTIKTFMS